MRRKLFSYVLLVMAGILSAVLLQKVSLLLLLFLIAWLLKSRSDSRFYVQAFIFGLLLLILFQFRYTHGVCHSIAERDKEVTVQGIVLDIETKNTGRYNIKIDVEGEKILASYYHNLDQPWKLIGKSISFHTKITLPDKSGNPRTFDYRQHLLSRGIAYTCVIDSFSINESQPLLYYRIKGFIMEKREAYLAGLQVEDTIEGVLRGVLFGDKNQMDEDIYDAFRKNGTAHVLAVSGLHVGMLYRIYQWIYERWKNPWLTTGFLSFLFVYGTAALWSVSVTRAIGLIIIVVIGKVFDRRYDLLTALSAMALFSIIKNPYVIFGAGFQMSFLAVISIAFLQRSFEKYVGVNWAAAFAVQAGLLPYMSYTFNYISFVGILCNVPVIFLASILVPMGMVGFILYLCFDMTIPGVYFGMEAVTNLMIWCNNLFIADGILSFDVISLPLWMIILLYGFMFFLASEYFHIYFFRKDWKKLLTALLIILTCISAGILADRTPFDQAELIFVDVGQGDCLHIKTPGQKEVLIDGGGKFGYNVGEKILKPYLLKNRITEINLAAATHLHLDHYEGLKQLADCYPVNQLLTEGKAGQYVKIEEGYWLEILWPKTIKPDTEDENENSLIFMVHHNGLKTLITGDITAEGEAMLLETYQGTDKLRADILKIPHHGSPYSSSDAFLEAVNPKIAVISVGKNNYGHPSEIVIEKLEENGIMVFRTDLDGAVGIINRKGKLSVCTEKQR